MNVTDKQWDLLDVLVSIHEANGGTEFHFPCTPGGGEISYAGGISVPGIYSETDLYQLRSEGLITLAPISQTVLGGKPTEPAIRRAPYRWHQRHNRITATPAIPGFPHEPAEAMSDSDIEFRVNAPAPTVSEERSTRKYEEKCPHLGSNAAQRLSQRRAERDKLLRENIEAAEAQIREQHLTLGRVTGQKKCEAAGTAPLQTEIAGLREKIIGVGTDAAADGVKEFAIGLLISQERVGVHSKWLREYTALLAAEIRATLTSSQVSQTTPLSPWSKDPIAQKAIHTCERILSERWKMRDGLAHDLARKLSESTLNWPAVVEEWEQLKAEAEIESGPQQIKADAEIEFGSRERIRESVLRAILSGQCHTNSDDLTDDQISQAGADLWRHYGSILIIPLDLEASHPPKSAPESIETSQFWKAREDEFRQHDTGRNAELGGRWKSWDGKWSFHCLSGMGSDCAESRTLFKSLAREAAKGLRGERGADSWLDLLRCEKDEDTGKLLFAEVTTGAWTTSEGDYAEMLQAGKKLSRPLIEFVPTSDGRIARRPYWDTTDATIENLFRASATLCLQLRSLAPSILQDRPAVAQNNPGDETANHSSDRILSLEAQNVASLVPANATAVELPNASRSSDLQDWRSDF